uniref:coproporphyrinogen oxidase n=2 Tax=Leptocylindrus danicus TaxID=163516 RepID=A0A7S2L134_9STRA|mmetsp:Transcript_2939/g.4214  ORF Transcript_2939/g.4214 Transcript_2939/m.4214 type:complete len:395 (+) Transcript_2939:90-1274(+)|eukprot:CAMPEP_0116008884 /NCGR_PEP_ID=MMETSP0321-20121206/3116_1 /TAXON_ID=163516 /ORGANISM="Leptocylindrus danicus var. danicus, Strain B650" /LENGTH=394 /DNA_ID=CAMNT_0003477767 /DNA_START=80 /DNA_END=1264 /DNA_ORIENTATION=+
MKLSILIFSAVATASNGFVPAKSGSNAFVPKMSATTETTETEGKEAPETEGKKAGDDAPPVNIGWDSHRPVEEVPDSLVREGDGPDGNYPMRAKFEKMCREAQIKITQAISDIDGEATFQEDAWVRANGGGGMSRVLSGGKVFEKAGVNLSVVYGSMPQEALQAATERGVDRAKGMAPGERVPFFACGLSSVMHPRNPHCPTMHFNYRYFETDGGVWWFGGGTDITPSFINEDDMKQFHGTYKEVCDKHDEKFYPEFKAWADRYFVIQHRNETRGLGGIFFDDLNDRDPNTIFEFSKECLNSVVKAYGPIIEKHKDDEFTQQEKEWQLMRRGRYVEFNLVYDRGTVFGLKTGGRIESILMSLPETARWEYDHQPVEGTKEYDFIDACRHPREWV